MSTTSVLVLHNVIGKKILSAEKSFSQVMACRRFVRNRILKTAKSSHSPHNFARLWCANFGKLFLGADLWTVNDRLNFCGLKVEFSILYLFRGFHAFRG